MISRLILWLALAGMILALHLWVQKARGFDQGCLGLETPAASARVAAGGCREVGDLPASHLLGVSNAAWGYAFYFAVALLAFGKIVVRPEWARRFHVASEALVVGAAAYSSYLVWQMGVVAHAWCVLCLLSAILVALLLGLHVAVRLRGGYRAIEDGARGRELGWAAGGLFAMMGLLVGVLLFVDRIGTRPPGAGADGVALRDEVWNLLNEDLDPEKLQGLLACRFDEAQGAPDFALLDLDSLPYLGRADGMPVVVFVDPRCGSCRSYFPKFAATVERLKDRARVVIAPTMLWDESVAEVAVVFLADRAQDQLVLWERLFSREGRVNGAPTREAIAGWCRDLGLSDSDLDGRLAAAQRRAEAWRERVHAAGLRGAPWVFINGRRVWSANKSANCLARLVERAVEETKQVKADAH